MNEISLRIFTLALFFIVLMGAIAILIVFSFGHLLLFVIFQ